MKYFHKTISFDTEKQFHFIDITDLANEAVKESGIKNGLINIQSLHTTFVTFVNENEPLLLSDIERTLERLIPQDLEYQHDNFEIRTVNVCSEEYVNGHAHCKAILLGPSETLNVIDGKIELGQWQRIFALELDRPRPRKVSLMIIGE